MSVAKSLVTRALQRLRQPPTPIGIVTFTSRSPTILPADVPIEEETIPGYNPTRFYPVNPGELLNNRYKALAKLGWGTTFTVWLARDTQRWWWNSNRYVTLKITASDGVDEDAAKHERKISRHLKANPSHGGFIFVRTLLDSFEATGPDGTHSCLIYEPMREPLWLFRERWENGKFPSAILKAKAYFIINLKLDNILVRFEHPSVIEDFVQEQAENPMPRKFKDGRSIYLSHNDFGRLRSFRILPIIADFGLAQSGDGSEPLRHPIQPPVFNAPEVLLGTSWTYSADIWNLGVLIWNLMEGKDLFRHIRSSQGAYDVRAHLAEMIALLGPPPKILADREKWWSDVKWSRAFPNSEGKFCQTAREYYGGPFFNSEGEFLHKGLVPTDVRLEDSVLSLEGEDKRLFLDFVKKMLQWLPEDRKSAKELLEDPWLVQ
ncbi:hypothetical protein MMC24_000932 [Lignoscripta atroalba]|nr:hypothetical protein [Lignoscripta atroalba]